MAWAGVNPLLMLQNGIKPLSKRDATPVYVFVACIGFAIMIFFCRKVCGRMCPSTDLIFETLDVDDIVVNFNEEDEASEELLNRKKKDATKLLSRPNMLTRTPTGKPSQKRSRQQQMEEGLEMTLYFDDAHHHNHSRSAHSSPQRNHGSAQQALTPDFVLRRPKIDSDDEKMDDTEAKGSKNQDDEDDDMWRLWQKTYDGKNTVALETEQKPKKEEEKSTAKAYQSIKFKKNTHMVPTTNSSTSPGNTLPRSPSKHNLPRLDLSPLQQQQHQKPVDSAVKSAMHTTVTVVNNSNNPSNNNTGYAMNNNSSIQLRPLHSLPRPLPPHHPQHLSLSSIASDETNSTHLHNSHVSKPHHIPPLIRQQSSSSSSSKNPGAGAVAMDSGRSWKDAVAQHKKKQQQQLSQEPGSSTNNGTNGTTSGINTNNISPKKPPPPLGPPPGYLLRGGGGGRPPPRGRPVAPSIAPQRTPVQSSDPHHAVHGIPNNHQNIVPNNNSNGNTGARGSPRPPPRGPLYHQQQLLLGRGPGGAVGGGVGSRGGGGKRRSDSMASGVSSLSSQSGDEDLD